VLVPVSTLEVDFAFEGASLLVVELLTTGGVSGIISGAGGGLGLLGVHISHSPFVIYIFQLSV
jgi:hypothetical protein